VRPSGVGSAFSQVKPTRSLDGFCLFPCRLQCHSAIGGEDLAVSTALPADKFLYILIPKPEQFAYSDYWQARGLSGRVIVYPIHRYVQPFRDFFGSEKFLHRSHGHRPYFATRASFLGSADQFLKCLQHHTRGGLTESHGPPRLDPALGADSMPICTAFGVFKTKVSTPSVPE
jgi:hypothetical protein